MRLGQISKEDIGRWLLLDDGRTMQLIGLNYGLLYCQATDGRWWIPIHDVVKRISEEDANEIIQKENNNQKNRKL